MTNLMFYSKINFEKYILIDKYKDAFLNSTF